MGSVEGGHSEESWWADLKAFCVRVSIQEWILILRNEFEFQWNDQPHLTRMILFHPKSGKYLTRIFGQTLQNGVLSHAGEIVSLAQKFFLQQKVCFGMTISTTPNSNRRFPFSLTFSPNCSLVLKDMTKTEPFQENQPDYNPQCEACALLVENKIETEEDHATFSERNTVEQDYKPELSEDDEAIPSLFHSTQMDEDEKGDQGLTEIEVKPLSDTRTRTRSRQAKVKPRNRFQDFSESDPEHEEEKVETDLVCPVCRKQYHKSTSLRRHLRELHLKAHFICMQCNPDQKAFDYPEEALNHYQTFHSAMRFNEFQIKCPNCRDVIDFGGNPDALIIHCRECLKAKKREQRQQRLKKVQGTPKPKAEFVCDECGKKFASAQCLRFHIKVHTGEDIISCPECPYKTPDPSRMKVHMRIHLRKQGLISKVVCDWCGLELRDNCSLKLHIATKHDSTKPMSSTCSFCQRAFSTKRSLSLHIARKHDTSDKFKCEECGKGFSRPSLLHFHAKNNHRAPAFKCGFCGKMMTSKISLTCHERIHTGENPYRCQLCDYSCKSSATLSLHRKFIHNQGKNLTEHPISLSTRSDEDESRQFDSVSIRSVQSPVDPL